MTKRKGFTLLELTLSIAISVIIVSGMWRMSKGGTASFLRALGHVAVIGGGERAMRGYAPTKGMLEDIRRCSAISAIQPDRLNLSCAEGAVSYSLQGTNLVRAVAGSTAAAANNITALNFRYYKIQNGLISLTTAPALVQAIEISGLRAVNRGSSYSVTSSARLRNY